MPIIGFDDFLDKPVPDDIPFIEIHELDSRDVVEDVAYFDQTRDAIGR